MIMTRVLILAIAVLALALTFALATNPREARAVDADAAGGMLEARAQAATKDATAPRRRLAKKKPTKRPTKFPTRRRPTKAPTLKPTTFPTVAPTTFAPTPSPSQGANEACCASTSRQASECLTISADTCAGRRRRQLTWNPAELDDESESESVSEDDESFADLVADEDSESDSDDSDSDDRRRLEAPGKLPCMYYFSTLTSLRNYVYGKLGLRGHKASRRMKGLFKQQGSFFCRPESGGGCGCHSSQGYCGFSSEYNCKRAAIRVSLPDGSVKIRRSCTWDAAASTCSPAL